MKHYLVTCEADIPPRKIKEYMINASSYHTACSRAVKQFKSEHVGRHRIPELKVKIVRY